MGLEETFNLEQVAQEVTGALYERMVGINLPEAEIHFTANILFEFAKIAGSLMLQEPGVEDPATNAFLEFDADMARQCVELFCEGAYFTAMKCREFGIEEELRSQLLQNVAQDIFTQTKQIVVSTYNQEATPEFQISKDQQLTWINQTAETALMYYINQHESQYGPIIIPQTDSNPSPLVPTELPGLPGSETELVSTSVPPPMIGGSSAATTPKGPNAHDKYAAVALLLTTLRTDQRQAILRRFNAEEKELISYYAEPEHIEQNLDLSCVNLHLQTFKRLLQQGSSQLKSKTIQAFETLFHQYSKAEAMRPVAKERPLLQQYVESYFMEAEEALPPAKRRGLPFSMGLPPKVEETLYQYLTQQLEPEGVGP